MKTCTKCLHAIPHPIIPSMCMKKHLMNNSPKDKCPDYAWQGDGKTYTVIENGKKVTRFTGQNEGFESYEGIIPEEFVEDLKTSVLKSPYLKRSKVRYFIRKTFYRFINLFRKGSR